MKGLKIFICLMVAAIASTLPGYSQNEIVAVDERPNVDFEEYKTYDWTTEAAGTSTVSTLNDAILKMTIKDAIQYELDARGYELGGADPELLINFQVFEEPTEIRGFTGDVEVTGTTDVQSPTNEKTYQLEEGSLLIQILDKEKGTVVWQGYASGIMDEEVFDRSPERIRDAVQQIFNKYEHSAN